MTRLLLYRRRPSQLADGRAQERSTSIAPTALYSATMYRLEADRPSLKRLLRTAKAVPGADLWPLSPSHARVLVATDGLKSHSGAPCGCRSMSLSRPVAVGSQMLLARLVPAVPGRARAIGGALGWGRGFVQPGLSAVRHNPAAGTA